MASRHISPYSADRRYGGHHGLHCDHTASFFELFLLCVKWEWERACERATEDNDGKISSGTKYHRTTVHKVLGVLQELDLITEVQARSIERDPDIVRYFYRHTKQKHTSDPSRHNFDEVKEHLIYFHDMRQSFNKLRLVRDIFFYPSVDGLRYAEVTVAPKYTERIDKKKYFEGLERLHERLPKNAAGMSVLRKRYRQRVLEETR